jgi:hypothetical protein
MAIDPVSLGTAVGVNLLAPVVAKGIGGLFGLDEPSEEERRAAARRQEAIDRLTAEAEGRTASPAQLAALAQQQRTQQALASLAQRGNVQQRAGNVRAAMQAAPEVMAQQGAVAAQTRAEEMARARNALAQAQMGVATQEAAQGAARREYMQRLIGAGIQGAAAVTGDVMTRSPDAATGGTGAAAPAATPAATAAAPATGTTAQAQTAAPVQRTALSEQGVQAAMAPRSMAAQGPAASVTLGQQFQPFDAESQLGHGGLQLGAGIAGSRERLNALAPLGAAGMNRRARPFSLNLGGR